MSDFYDPWEWRDDSLLTGHDCEVICNQCNGSGEGHADGTRCWKCKGSGSEVNNGFVTAPVYFEYKKTDPTVWRLAQDRYCECCGHDFEPDVEENIDYEGLEEYEIEQAKLIKEIEEEHRQWVNRQERK